MIRTITATKLGIAVCIGILSSACSSEKNPEISGNFYNPRNTLIKFPSSAYQSDVKTQLENALHTTIENNIPNVVSPQNVSVEWDSTSDSPTLLLTFSPAEENIDIAGANSNSRVVDPANPDIIPGFEKNRFFSPSMISINKNVTTKLPCKIEGESLEFSGEISTEYFDYDISGNLSFNNKKFDLSDVGNKLEITINSQKLKNDWGWCEYNELANGNRIYQTYWVDKINPADGVLSNTGWNCELTGANMDFVENLGFSIDDLFNLIINLKDADGNEPGNLFDTKGITFDPSGNLWMSDKINSDIYLYHGYIQFPQLLYSPASIRFIPLSENEIILFGYPSLLKGFLNYDYKTNEMMPMIYTSHHTSQYIKLLKALSTDMPQGIRLTKSIAQDASATSETFILTFDNEVGRKILSIMIEPLSNNSYREGFVNAVTAIYPTISADDLNSALLQLPTLVQQAADVKLGIRLKPLEH